MTTRPDTRPLGYVQLIALGLNGIVGVGIFFVPASVAVQVKGPLGALVYAATALACLPIARAFGRLGQAAGEDGGPYVFARSAFGPNAAFVVGWLTFGSAIFSTSAVTRGLVEALLKDVKFEPTWFDPVAVGASLTVLVLGVLVAMGLRIAAWSWTAITAAKLVPLGLLAAVGVWALVRAPIQPGLLEVPSVGPTNILRAGLLVLFALQGFEVVAVPAGHARRPEMVARSTWISLVLASLLYVVLHFSAAAAVPSLATSGAPLVDAGNALGGSRLARIVGIGTSISAVGIALGMVAMTPRYLAALGKPDGLGSWIGHNDARGVPLRALIVTCVGVILVVQSSSLESLFALSSIAVLCQYATTAAALGWLGIRKRQGFGWFDVVTAVVALGVSSTIALGASVAEVKRALLMLVVGIGLRVAYVLVHRGAPGMGEKGY